MALPPELQRQIIGQQVLSFDDIENYCATHPLLHKLCHDRDTWIFLLDKFGRTSTEFKNMPLSQLKQLYKQLMNQGRLYELTLDTSQRIDTTPQQISSFDNICYVSCGLYHTAFITATGSLYTFGDNKYGQLGIGTTTATQHPIKVASNSPVIMVACGGKHTAFITEQSQLYTFGSNKFGQLGVTGMEESLKPLLVASDAKVISVACGYDHTAFITESGRLYICGHYGAESIYQPVQLNILSNVTSVSCGEGTTMYITEAAEAYAFGINNRGQLGLGNNNYTVVPTAIYTSSKKKFHNVKQISCARYSSTLLTTEGQVYYFGETDKANKIIATPKQVSIDHIDMIATGYRYTLCLAKNGQLKVLLYDKVFKTIEKDVKYADIGGDYIAYIK